MDLKVTALILFISLCSCSELDNTTKGTPKGTTQIQKTTEGKLLTTESSVSAKLSTKTADSSNSSITIITPAPDAPTSQAPASTTHPTSSTSHSTSSTSHPTSTTPHTSPTSSPSTSVPSTTHIPSSTPHPPPATSTVAPTPKPVVNEAGDWKLNYTASSVCVRLVGAVKLYFNLRTSNGTNPLDHEEIFVPKDSHASGNCTEGILTLTWPSNKSVNSASKNDSISFSFESDKTTQTWKLASVQGDVTARTNEGIHFHTNATSGITTHNGTSYLCSKQSSFNLDFSPKNLTGLNVTAATLFISQFQVEAFKAQKLDNLAFSPATNCEFTPDVVPIVVGCALAALVVAVLIAYVIAQRRPFAQGYRSV